MIIINGHNLYPSDMRHEIEADIAELMACVICIFSVDIGGKERIILCIEHDALEPLQYSELSGMNQVVREKFDVSSHEIVFLERNSLARTDNGKLQIHSIRRAYQSGESVRPRCLQFHPKSGICAGWS